MPTVVAGAIVSAIGLTGVAGTIATALIGAGASFALSSLTAKPVSKRANGADPGRRIELVRDATLPRRVVYGRARVSGPIAFAHTHNGEFGQTNSFLHLIIPLATHELASLGDCYVDDVKITPASGAQGWLIPPEGNRYRNSTSQPDGVVGKHFVQWRAHLGTMNDAADSFLMNKASSLWTTQHKLSGIAYAYVQLMWDQNVWAGGLPNLSFTVEGKPVFDPRTGTTAFSSNPALIIRDYLLAPYGLACAVDELDEASFIAAANLCDELVPTGSGGEQKRYTCDGVISLDDKPIEIMERLLTSCAGALVYTQGTYKLYPAAYRTPSTSLHEGHLRGAVKVRPMPPVRARVNTVRGTFIDPVRGWQESDFPPVQVAQYVSADGGERVQSELELPFTQDAITAQRLARLTLERARRQLTVEAPATLAALDVAVMEPLMLTLPPLGWSEKVFTPTEWSLAADGGVDLTLLEDDPAIYAWNGANSTTPPQEVALPSIYPDPPAPQVTDSVVTSAGGSAIHLFIMLGTIRDAFHARYEVEYRLSGETAWQPVGSGSVPGVHEGDIYEVRARAFNIMGVASAWATITHQVVGSAAPPADVHNLTAALIDNSLTLEWAAATGLIASYRLRWAPAVVGASWASAIDIVSVPNTRASVPARMGTYFVKAVDTLARESTNAAMLINSVADAGGLNIITTLTEHPHFSGTKTNALVNGSSFLQIDSLTAFDALAGNFDSSSGNFDVAGGGASPEGIYNFAVPVDLAQVYLARLSGEVKASVVDYVTDFETATGLFDGREGSFDGEAPSAVDVVLEVATTPDNPSGSPIWSAWQKFSVGDYVARGLKFRARLTTQNSMATPMIEELKVKVEMPDRVLAGNDVTSSTSGTSISFSPAFKSTPTITITPADMASGDYFTLSAKSRTGFTVQFKNASGTGISRTFDWTARGYGRQQ
jgi:hypothetical protein